MDINRKCTKCQRVFPATNEFFHKSNTSKHGLHSRCKSCKKNIEIERRLKNPEKAKDRDKFFRNKYKEKIAVRVKEYYQKNKKGINERRKKRYKEKYYNDPKYKMKILLRGRFRSVVIKKHQSSIDCGCSVDELISHIESQFIDGMTWENHGKNGWHIDHIKPCCSFDLTDPQQQKECFHYTNLRPLWAIDNLKKGGKFLQ